MHRDIVPIGEGPSDQLSAFGIVGRKIGERLVGQDDAPAKSVVWPVTLNNNDLVRRITKLQCDCEIKASGTAAEANRTHDYSSKEVDYYNPIIFKLKAFSDTALFAESGRQEGVTATCSPWRSRRRGWQRSYRRSAFRICRRRAWRPW